MSRKALLTNHGSNNDWKICMSKEWETPNMYMSCHQDAIIKEIKGSTITIDYYYD